MIKADEVGSAGRRCEASGAELLANVERLRGEQPLWRGRPVRRIRPTDQPKDDQFGSKIKFVGRRSQFSREEKLESDEMIYRDDLLVLVSTSTCSLWVIDLQ